MSVIDERYAALGGPNGFLGQSVSDEQPTPDGRARVHIYETGAIYWIILDRSGAGMGLDTYEVHGAIWLLYQALEKEPGRA